MRMTRPINDCTVYYLVLILLYVSALYLTLPVILFLWGWLRPTIAVGVITTLALAVVLGTRSTRQVFAGMCTRGEQLAEQTQSAQALVEGSQRKQTYRWRMGQTVGWLAVLVLAITIVLLWGTGGYGPQDSDHPKHNAILKTLIAEPWPAVVASDRGSFPLVFYVAYYLPAAAVGKIGGWEAANQFLQWWTVLGLVLSFGWFCILVGTGHWVVGLVFFFFSGLDVVGASLIRLADYVARVGSLAELTDWQRIDWFALRWWNWQMRWWDVELARNYPNPIEQLFFVPHQAVAGWMVTGILGVLAIASPVGAAGSALVWCSLLSLWSPLVLIGFVPLVGFMAVESLRQRRGDQHRWQEWFSVPNLLSLPALGVIGLYYLARFSSLPFTNVPEAEFGIGHPRLGWALFLVRVLMFLVLEVGILAIAVESCRPWKSEREKTVFRWILGWLAVLPLFRYGACNDLVMRACVPGLFLLAAWSARACVAARSPRIRRWILAGLLVIGATSPLSDFYAHFREALRVQRIASLPPEAQVPTLWELNLDAARKAESSTHPLVRNFRGDVFFLQYVGSKDSLFFRWLSRPVGEATLPARGITCLQKRAMDHEGGTVSGLMFHLRVRDKVQNLGRTSVDRAGWGPGNYACERADQPQDYRYPFRRGGVASGVGVLTAHALSPPSVARKVPEGVEEAIFAGAGFCISAGCGADPRSFGAWCHFPGGSHRYFTGR